MQVDDMCNYYALARSFWLLHSICMPNTGRTGQRHIDSDGRVRVHHWLGCDVCMQHQLCVGWFSVDVVRTQRPVVGVASYLLW